MATSVSSLIGVDFNNPSSTALFALGTEDLGTQASEWTYCVATGTLTTGQLVAIFPSGTAYAFTTALLNGGDTAGTTGNLNLGAIQTNCVQGNFAWVARKGVDLYIATTGTIPLATNVGFSPTAGAICTALLVAVGQTAAGIFITTSASTATAATAKATLQYPRAMVGVPQS